MARRIRFSAYMGGGLISQYSGNFLEPMTLFNTDKMDDYGVTSCSVSIEVNKVSAVDFTVTAEHPLASKIEKYRNWLFLREEIIDDSKNTVIDSENLFYGRVISVDTDLYGNKTVNCESSLGFLNDLVSKPNDYGYSSVSEFISRLLAYGYDAMIDGDTSTTGIRKAFKKITWSYDSDSNPISSEIGDDASNDTIFNIMNKYILDESGGFLIPFYHAVDRNYSYDNFANLLREIETTLRYYSFNEDAPNFGIGVSTYNPLRRYPHEEAGQIDIDDQPYTWLPRFTIGRNIISLSKEPALETIFTGVYPVGKNNTLLQNPNTQSNTARFLWNSSAVEKYGRIAIPISFPEVSIRSNLRTLSQNWLTRHVSDDLFNEFKYTVTAPEPAVLGYGSKLIRIMCSVMYSEDMNKKLYDYDSYPCLSMKIDIFNPQNNQYTFGPYVSDNYSETNISSSKDYAK